MPIKKVSPGRKLASKGSEYWGEKYREEAELVEFYQGKADKTLKAGAFQENANYVKLVQKHMILRDNAKARQKETQFE